MKTLIVVLAAVLAVGCGGGYNSNSKSNQPSSGNVTISTLSPPSTTHGGPAFTLTVNGSGFGTDAVVYFNGTTHATTYITSGQVMVGISAADVANTGTAQVYVRTGGMNSNTMNFTVD